MTITDGMVVGGDGGGAILNAGSSLTLANDVLSNNEVLSDAGGNAQGGAIVNVSGATLTVSNSLLSHNQAKGSSGGSPANGGGIVNSSSRLTVNHSTFAGNQALGGDGGGNAAGGGIVNNQSGTAAVRDSIFTGNQARGADGGVLGAIPLIGMGQGGAIFNDARLTRAVHSRRHAWGCCNAFGSAWKRLKRNPSRRESSSIALLPFFSWGMK